MVATSGTIVGERLCESVDLRAGQRVLDVATGSGNTALAAARRHCDVIGVDFVPSLLERARERAAVERLRIEFREADTESLPFADASFDVVLSTFGVMFAPDQARAAAELLRVVRISERPERIQRPRGMGRVIESHCEKKGPPWSSVTVC